MNEQLARGFEPFRRAIMELYAAEDTNLPTATLLQPQRDGCERSCSCRHADADPLPELDLDGSSQ